MITTGVAWFDDPSIVKNTEGWYSVRGENAQRFSRHSDLPSDCIFITNMTFESLGKINISRHNLKLESFVGNTLEDVLSDLGVDVQIIGIPEVVKTCSCIFDAAFNLAQQVYGEDVLSGFGLHQGIASCIQQPIAKEIKEDLLLCSALSDAYLRTTVCEFSKSSAWIATKPISHKFRFNRTLHTLSVLKKLVPKGNHKMIDTSDSVENILAMNLPALVRVSVRNFNHDAAPIFAFGTRFGAKNRGSLRTWVTSYELAMLNEIAIVETLNYPWFVWEGGWAHHDYKLPDELLNPMIAASYPGQLLAEAFLSAILNPPFESGRKFYTPSIVFLSAIERIQMYQTAQTASRIPGVTVLSYGQGRMKAHTRTSHNNESIIKWSKNNGFVFPPEYAFTTMKD